jgi:hypothetical protein
MAWGLVMVKKKRENRPNISVGSVRTAGEKKKNDDAQRGRSVGGLMLRENKTATYR